MEKRDAISMLNFTARYTRRTIKRTTIFDNKPLDRRKFLSLRHMAWCIFFIFSLFWTFVSTSEIICPSACTCTYSERLIDCSKRSLKKIPSPIPTWVSKLTFQNNKLVATEIKEEIFSNLINLKELDFSDNPLEEVNVALRGLPKLRVLRFDRCALLRIPNVGSITASNLHHLSLARNRISDVGDRLKRFPSLRILNLSHNKLQRNLPGKAFSHQRNLTHLYLQRNKITGFEVSAFQGLTSLETLSLARNKIRGLRHLCMSGPKETGDCGNTLRKLKFIDLSKNLLTRIEGLAFQGLNSLNILLLNNNQINTLMDGAFVTLNSLSTLKLDNNRIPRVSKTWLFDLKSLQTLSLSHNNITTFDRQGWKFCKSIKYLNLSFNSLTIVHTENFSPLEGLQTLNLSHNGIVVIEDHAFRNLLSLGTLDLSHNRISSSVEDINGAFLGLSTLRNLHLQDNKIRSFSSSMLRGAENLEELNIRRNNLTTVQNDSFSILSNLRMLAMNSSSFLCDCQLTWFSEWLRNHHGDNMTSQVDVRCFHPPSLKNRKVEDVKPLEFECGEHPVPALLQQPSLLTSPRGGNVTLQCSASATLTGTTTEGDIKSVFMTVVWRRGQARDIIAESQSVRILNQQKQEGGHIFFTSFLLLYNVDFDDDEEYRCVISNEFGHAMSTPAHLNVYSVPVIKQRPRNKVVKYGSEVVMPCQVSGYPLPKVSWTKEGEKKDFPAAKESRLLVGEPEMIFPLYHSQDDNSLIAEDFLGRRGGGLSPGSDDVKVSKAMPKLAEMAAPLHITKLKPEDAGVYTCTAESAVGIESRSATLTVLYPPIVDSMPEETQSVRGGHAVLKCMASAYPQPEITWYVDGGVLNGTTRHFFAADGKILVIVDASEADEGQYTCAVRNDLGETKQTTQLILVDSLDTDEGAGNFDNFFGTNGIVVLAVFVCIILTSLVWLLVLCHTKRNNEGALSGFTDATDVALDSSSHGSLERGHSHSMQCMNNINHSRYDLMSRYLDPSKNCIPDHPLPCYQDPGMVLHQHPDQFRSVPRNCSTRFPLPPHPHHVLQRAGEDLRIQRGLPLRSASTPHVYGLDRPSPRGNPPLARPPLHSSTLCVGNPPCREQQHHRLPACRTAAQSKRRRRRRRLLEQGEEHRESGGGSSRMTYSSSSEAEFEKQPLMSVISTNGTCTSTARVIPTKNVEYDPRRSREQSLPTPAEAKEFSPGRTSNGAELGGQGKPADEPEPVQTGCFRNDVDLSSINSEPPSAESPWKQKGLSNDS